DWHSRIALNISPAAAIPKTASVESATVGLYASSGATNTSGVELLRATKPWNTPLNWLTYNGVNPWTTEGGDYSSLNEAILTKDRGSQAGWWTFSDPDSSGELRALVQEWVAGAPNMGFIVKLSDDMV